MFKAPQKLLYLAQDEKQLEDNTGLGFVDYDDFCGYLKKRLDDGDILCVARVNDDEVAASGTLPADRLS